jgi:methionine synthase I (cobalamin-dependent)
MRALLVCLIGMTAAFSGTAVAQMKLSTKSTPGANETRYFTSIDGLMQGNADVILKETRQGKTVTAAVLDVCYPAEKGSDRKDRFVANLAVSGQTLTGISEIGSQIHGRHVRVQRPDHHRPDHDRGDFDR